MAGDHCDLASCPTALGVVVKGCPTFWSYIVSNDVIINSSHDLWEVKTMSVTKLPCYIMCLFVYNEVFEWLIQSDISSLLFT